MRIKKKGYVFMKSIDQKLTANRYRFVRKEYLSKQLQQIDEQLKLEEQTRSRLKSELEKENEDVARLEHTSLNRLFSVLNGKGELRLEKEKAEAFRAALDYNLKLNDIDYLRHQKNLLVQELKAYDNLGLNYQELLEIKRKTLSMDTLNKIREAEKQLTASEQELKQLKEAQISGNKLRICFTYILDHLSDLVEDSTDARSLWYPVISQEQIDDVMQEITKLNTLWKALVCDLQGTDILSAKFDQDFLLQVSDCINDADHKQGENKRINTSFEQLNATYSDVRNLLCMIQMRIQELEYHIFDQRLRIEEGIATGE